MEIRCRKCGQWKDEEEFSWRWKDKGIRQPVCKACRGEVNAQWYESHKEEQKERSRKHKQEALGEAQRYVYEVLSYSTCEDCGEYDFAVLTFHHVREVKRMDVSQMAAQGYSISAIQSEINKCVVLCFNCHARRENEKKSGGRFRRFWPKFPWEE
jgi:hypothetical protein